MWDYRFSMKLPRNFTEDDLLFSKQLGVENVYTIIEEEDQKRVPELCERVRESGLNVYSLHSRRYTKNPKVILGLPGRDDVIEGMIGYLHQLGELGVRCHTMTWEPDMVWTTHFEGVARHCRTRYVNLSEMKGRPLTHDRMYSPEELWDNFAYLMERIIPEAEGAGVKIALHPNDPPTYSPLGGVPCLIKSLDDYKKAFAIAGEPLKMEFCCGCWLEGQSEGFGDVLRDLAECLRAGRVEIVHFRNITSPLPEFTECFQDMGFFNMHSIMKVLYEHNYRGVITLDHSPMMVDGPKLRAPHAYAIGYMRGLATSVQQQ